MDTENAIPNHQPSIVQRLRSAVVPVLLIAVGYVDPGKWATAVEGGAHFGSELILLMLVFNFASILCQYLSARIAVVTGRDLSQICSEEYGKVTCIFLGVLTELSMIALDLTMILGTAHGLNLILGVELFTCVFLTGIDAILFPVFARVLDNGKAKLLCISMASFVLPFYVFGVLFSQPETSISRSGMLTKLSGESAFALMSLLGANIMPHNFYLHSSIVQQELRSSNVSKGVLCHDHLFAVLCIFSGIFLVNYVLMNAAANVFHSTGLVLLTFQDALSLMDQVLKSSTGPFAFLLVLFVCSQITALTWNLGRQAVLHNLFGVDIPGWLHYATIRIIAFIPAIYCVWNSGAEGTYQLLILTQVLVALLLPSSMIPLFRVASSRSVMGGYKISQFVEFLALILFFGILGSKMIFLVEMMFGNSDWVGYLKWNVGSSISTPYIVLLVTGSTSFCLMLWLAVTPLKSTSSTLDAQLLSWGITDAVPESSAGGYESQHSGTRYVRTGSILKHEPSIARGKLGIHSNISILSTDIDLPETLLDSDCTPWLTSVDENVSNIVGLGPSMFPAEESATTVETVEASVCRSEDSITLRTESTDIVEKTVRIEGGLQKRKDEEIDKWKPEEAFKGVSGNCPSLTSDGPASYKSVSGKGDGSGSGAGSLSRLAGLGRAARRQFAGVLDEFWGQLFDFHGQATLQAKTKKLDTLFGIDSKIDPKPATPMKLDTSLRELTGYFLPVVGRGSDSPMNSSGYDSPRLLGVQGSMESSYGAQRGPSSSWSSSKQLLDAHVQTCSSTAFDSAERRYSSLRLPPSSSGDDYQPATVHGYQIASYISRIDKEKSSDCLNVQMGALTPKSPSLHPSNYRDQASGRKLHNGLSTIMKPPGFSNPVAPRNISLQSERPFNDIYSAGPAKNFNSTVNEKKFHSLPDISGLTLPYRESYLSDVSTLRDRSMGYGPYLYSNDSFKTGTPLAFDNISPSKPYRDPLSLQFNSSSATGSLWSRQPFEQFGVGDKTHSIGSGRFGHGQSSLAPETSTVGDLEAKILQSFRHCIVKLLKLEGSDWLFRQNDGADEDLIDRVAARERFLYEAETRELNHADQMGEPQYSFDVLKNDETDYARFVVSSVPQCGEGCVWRVDLIISFGVWCIHRVLELSLMESRPELWGKYTYVLNRLQGIIDLAFSKPRTPMTPCFCLQIPVSCQQRSSPPISNGSLPPPAKQARGKCTTAALLLDTIKDVETAISCRKGRTGTAAGDVAFPKGKENLASVLKRYKRRLSNKTVGHS